MAEDKITTTSGMQPRSTTQETPQQVRLREAREAASRQTTEEAVSMDVPGTIGRMEDALNAIGQEALHLPSSEELATFLGHVAAAKNDLAVLAATERQKALAVAPTTEGHEA